MTYGFASISLQVGIPGEGLRVLSTKDIACACDRDDQEASVLGMVDALISGSDDEAIRWMFGEGQARENRYALVESGTVSDTSESLSSFLALCERAVRGYEANLNYFCTHAHCRTVKTNVMVSPLQMRRLGREELLWLAGNPDVLHATDTKTPLRINGRYVVPAHMRTERPKKTFDTKENRALLSYAEEVAAALGRIIEGAQDDIAHIEAMIGRLEGLDDGEGLIPALLMLRTCFEREQPLLRKAIALRKRMRSIAKALDRALPDVCCIRYRLPKRTKIFQEIPAYAEIHALMRAWDAFGEFQMQRDGMVLHTWKMDKLYEYYVLYELLSVLRGRGFSPNGSLDASPIEQAHYSLDSRYFQNETQVATVFRLVRGDERITLYYQPVIYGDEREEHGISLHRTTLTSAGFDSYWTPDYLIVHESCEGTRTLVLDAKFRKVSAVKFDGSENDAKSCMLECLRKYKLETCGSGGASVDALWLLCGRTQSYYLESLQQSSWALKQRFTPDGIAAVAPGANALSEFLDVVRIGTE